VDPAELSEVSEICEVLSHPRDADPTINSRAKAGMKMKKCSNQEASNNLCNACASYMVKSALLLLSCHY